MHVFIGRSPNLRVRSSLHYLSRESTPSNVICNANVKEQDKSSDIEQQPPFGDRKYKEITWNW